MIDADRAYDMLVAANPVEHPERHLDVDLDAEFARTTSRPLVPVRTSPQSVVSWKLIAAAFGVAVIVFGSMALRPGNNAATGDDPGSVVEAFFGSWNAGAIDAAMSYVDPAVSLNGGSQGASDVRALMSWASELSGRMETSCVQGEVPSQLVCDWAFSSAVAAALELQGASERTITVREGLIVSMTTPNYGALERAYAEFAREFDPAGYTAECDTTSSARSGYGFAFTSRCGAFFADLEPALLSQLTSSQD